MIWLLFLPSILWGGWAEDTLEQMSLDEKIGQLFMAPACPLREREHWEDWLCLIQDFHIGNVIVKQSDPISQVRFLNELQGVSKWPLLVAADAEWGLAMRMSDTIAFPRNMTLGAIADLDLIYAMGAEIGRQAKGVGVHLNLAPVADINTDPENPIIGIRSFGEDPEKVSLRVSAYLRGMEDAGVLTCPKHFPGHGSAVLDSHFDLPILPLDWERVNEVEFIPFERAIQEGASCLMSGHLLVPCIDPIYPASLSGACLKTVLRGDLGFAGLIVTDALNMSALTKRYSYEQIALLAAAAGSDILLYGDHINPNVDQILREQIPRAFQALKEGYSLRELDSSELDRSVLRILQAKEKLRLNEHRTVPLDDLFDQLHSESALTLKKKLFQEAVTLIGDPVALGTHVAYVSIGEGDVLASAFPHVLEISDKRLHEFDQIVVAVHTTDLSEEVRKQIHDFSEKMILCLFVTPYVLKDFKEAKSILLGYANDPDAQWVVYSVLMGKRGATGALPIGRGGKRGKGSALSIPAREPAPLQPVQ